ncbi:hypothetical protein GCM10011515_10090 [Tsuneonella deserti]|uniref:Uncharacterized protein n=1 Tax=Tsuneonella deserti TaxID=2035528 RepID=A0ABQ1S7E7_9SPHN|nr:hypothetical protein [Tsuneonella deserti]GGD92358.1 hypothetical protein GCM10011515_10090 [Tsuneonella deserti]
MPVPARPIAERRIVEHFMSLDAVGPDCAIAYASGRPVRNSAFERLQREQVLRLVPGGRWYLDTPTWTKRRRERRTRAAIALVGVLLAAAIGSAL